MTVFGESAGSASIAYHLLSPLARGLFKVHYDALNIGHRLFQSFTMFYTARHPSKQLGIGLRMEAPHPRARQTICQVPEKPEKPYGRNIYNVFNCDSQT